MAASDPAWVRDLHVVADRQSVQYQRAFIASVLEARADLSVAELERLLRAGDVAGAFALAEAAYDVAEAGLQTRIHGLTIDTMRQSGAAALAAQNLTLDGGFNVFNPATQQWAQHYTYDLVREMRADQITAIRNAVQRTTAGATYMEAAREIRGSIGLTARMEESVARYRARLATQGLRPERVDTLTSRYRDKAIRRRAETIARTESVRAVNQGQVQAWREWSQTRQVPVMKRWITTRDDLLCATCRPMNKQAVPLNAQFQPPSGARFGGVDAPPLHPNCRCVVALVRPSTQKQQQAALQGMRAPVTPLSRRWATPKVAPPLNLAHAAIQEAVVQAVTEVAAASAPPSAPTSRWRARSPEEQRRIVEQNRARREARRLRERQAAATRAEAKATARQAAKADARAQAKAARFRAEERAAALRREADANAARRAERVREAARTPPPAPNLATPPPRPIARAVQPPSVAPRLRTDILDAEWRGVVSNAARTPGTRIEQAFRDWLSTAYGPSLRDAQVGRAYWDQFLQSSTAAQLQAEMATTYPSLAAPVRVRTEAIRQRARESGARYRERQRQARLAGQPAPRLTASAPPPRRGPSLASSGPDPDRIPHFHSVRVSRTPPNAATWESFFGRGTSLEDAFRQIAIPSPDGALWAIDAEAIGSYGTTSTKFSISGSTTNGSIRTTRSFSIVNGKKTVDHDFLKLYSDALQKSKFSKRQIGKQFRWYRDSGVDFAKVHANIDIGGYAWARAGLLPTASSRQAVAEYALRRADALLAERAITQAQYATITRHVQTLARGRSESLWDIADMRDIVTGGRHGETMELGKHLLINSDWYGVVDMANQVQTERLFAYYGA